jgi:hypothetical protein
MQETESLDHRQRRLLRLAEVLEKHIDEGWIYVLVLGKPGEAGATNLLTNAPPKKHSEILEMLRELVERHKEGVKPEEL